LIITCTDKKI